MIKGTTPEFNQAEKVASFAYTYSNVNQFCEKYIISFSINMSMIDYTNHDKGFNCKISVRNSMIDACLNSQTS
jgi:hypothetical protein